MHLKTDFDVEYDQMIPALSELENMKSSFETFLLIDKNNFDPLGRTHYTVGPFLTQDSALNGLHKSYSEREILCLKGLKILGSITTQITYDNLPDLAINLLKLRGFEISKKSILYAEGIDSGNFLVDFVSSAAESTKKH